MTKLIATMALAGLLLATLACRTAEVVERATPGPPTVTPRPSFDSFNYPTNVPTPIPDFDERSRLLNNEMVRRGLATPAPAATTGSQSDAPRGVRRRGTPQPLLSPEECRHFKSMVDSHRALGGDDQLILDGILEEGTMTAEGVEGMLASCDITLDAMPRPVPTATYAAPSARDCREIKELIAQARLLGQNDQTQYEELMDSTRFTATGADRILRQAGECGVRLNAEPIPRHADFLVFQ